MEWAVRPSHRNRGVGRRLMDCLLADRPEVFAVLAAYPDAVARDIYLRWGWLPAGGSESSDLMPAMDHLVLPLRR